MSLFVGLPVYGGQRFNTVPLMEMMRHQRCFAEVNCAEMDSSLLAYGFNSLLLTALEYHALGHADFFLLLHADIIPINVAGWLDDLMMARREVVQRADRPKCEVLSAVVPIKDRRGTTSTGIEGPLPRGPVRYTIRQTLEMPVTFTHPELLVNTGLLLIDLRNNEWIRKICFSICDEILEFPDGRRMAAVGPEDWNFSRQARAAGVTLWATRAVKLNHRGTFNYDNFTAWGEATDPGESLPERLMR
jgi:hypothetical protein